MATYDLSLNHLRGVGPRTLQNFASYGINNLWDLILWLPSRYEDRSFATTMAHANLQQPALFDGKIIKTWVQYGRRRMLCCKIEDETGSLILRWFNFNRYQEAKLQPGQSVRAYGAPVFWQKHLELMHPQIEVYQPQNPPSFLKSPLAVYRSIPGVSQTKLRGFMQQALSVLAEEEINANLEGLFPDEFPDFVTALRMLHRPEDKNVKQQLAAQRLIVEELLAQVWFLRQSNSAGPDTAAVPVAFRAEVQAKLLAQFDFVLTNSQQTAVAEINADLQGNKPMQRLLQGDVGSGKTAVAALASWQVVATGRQVAWMAPTTILAEQHFATLKQWFEPLGVKVIILTGKLTKKIRNDSLADIKTAAAEIIVGTHALFQADIAYKDLGLLVIDEQHRFGVGQRAALKVKAAAPHCLSLTATPIPRTLLQSWFAGIDSSQLTEKPACRVPIETVLLESGARAKLIKRLSLQVATGARAYWVCSLIDPSEMFSAHAATEVHTELSTALPEVNIGLLHGQLSETEKLAIMQDFAAGKIAILVATTVIEVGVDVPEASLMVIDNPERFGLAQLHQLRGRVGRGSEKSYCLLLAGDNLSPESRQRLEILRNCDDGFELAEQDLSIRGHGQLLGAMQSGHFIFRIADLLRDAHFLPLVNKLYACLSEKDNDSYSEHLSRWLPESAVEINA